MEIAVSRLKTDHGEAYKIFAKQLHVFTDLKSVFHDLDILEKREFIDLVFDSDLYYENGIYRTPSMTNLLSANYLKMRDLGVMIVDKKRDDLKIIPASALAGTTIEQIIPLLTLFESASKKSL